jgi:hypothetical protein
MPAILTTVTISFGLSAQDKPGRPATDKAVAPPISWSVSRLFIIPSQEQVFDIARIFSALAGMELGPDSIE